MTEQGAGWERLDATAATPQNVTARPAATGGAGTRPLRMRRSRQPVLASLDGGGAVFQRRMRDVLVGSTLILVPAIALNFWVTVIAFDRFDPNVSSQPWFPAGSDTGVEDIAILVTALSVGYTTAVVGHFAAQILIGERFRRPVTLGRALARTGRRLPAIFAAWLLTHWWYVLAALIIATSRLEDAIGLSVLYVFVAWFASAATLMVIPAMVGEGLGPFAAAKRNWTLIRLRYGMCLAFVFLATVLSTLMLVGIATLVPVLRSLGFVTFGAADGIVQGVMIQMAALIVIPLTALGTAQAYIEVRLSGEALDLVIDTDLAFGPRESS